MPDFLKIARLKVTFLEHFLDPIHSPWFLFQGFRKFSLGKTLSLRIQVCPKKGITPTFLF